MSGSADALRVALLTSTLSPAAGGLATSVPALAHHLSALAGVHVDVVGTLDPNHPGTHENWGPNVHAHDVVGPRILQYAPGMAAALRALDPDVIDVQGLWTFVSMVSLRTSRSLGKPYVVTPRGMLDPWARRNARWKKIPAGWLYEDEHLRRAACLRATSEKEAQDFRSMGLRNPIAVVPNGVEIPVLCWREMIAQRRLLFLSRIHPVKGIPFLLRAWENLQSGYPAWELVIAGPDERGHETEMKALAKGMGLDRVRFVGPAHGREKARLYRSADLFVLPTHTENFGHVIAEALAHEVPVVTTRNAPWAGLEEHGCGWWIPLEQAALESALAEAMSKPREELHARGAKGRAWVEREFGCEEVARRMLEVYQWVCGRARRPDSVIV